MQQAQGFKDDPLISRLCEYFRFADAYTRKSKCRRPDLDPEELRNEAFAKLIEAIRTHKLRGPITRQLIATTINNLLKDHDKHNKRVPRSFSLDRLLVVPPSRYPGPEELVLYDDAVSTIFTPLKREERAALWLSVHEVTADRIAEINGEARSTALSRISRTKQKVRSSIVAENNRYRLLRTS